MNRTRILLAVGQAAASIAVLLVVYFALLKPDDPDRPPGVNAPRGEPFIADATFKDERPGDRRSGGRGSERRLPSDGAPAPGAPGDGLEGDALSGGAFGPGGSGPGTPESDSPSDDQYGDALSRILAPVKHPD